MSLIAIVTTLEAGYAFDKQQMVECNLKVGDRIPVRDIDMGQSRTTISLDGYKGSFNSVFFEFEENDKEIDIYGDKRYNPYLSMYDDCNPEDLL